MKLQRYNLGELASHYASDKDNVVCRAYDVEKLEESHKELLNQLEYMASQHRCGCGHPHCNRCEDDRMNQEIINKVKGKK